MGGISTVVPTQEISQELQRQQYIFLGIISFIVHYLSEFDECV